MLAPMAKEEKCISFLWMIVVPLFLVIMMKYLHLGYWPGFLVFSFVPLQIVLLQWKDFYECT